MSGTTKSFKIAGCAALLFLGAACTPYGVRQAGIYGPPVSAQPPNPALSECLRDVRQTLTDTHDNAQAATGLDRCIAMVPG